jgi:nucleoid-associated protein YgaU
MGLFDFAKEIGRKLFGGKDSPEEAAAKIQQEIAAANLGIVGLNVAYADGLCLLSGDCPSVEAMEKAVLIAGNVQGVSEVDVRGLKVPAPPPAEPQPKVEYYLIEKGDTLSKIAKHYYGNANQYPRIFEANREVIKDADLIFPGQKIRIPLD